MMTSHKRKGKYGLLKEKKINLLKPFPEGTHAFIKLGLIFKTNIFKAIVSSTLKKAKQNRKRNLKNQGKCHINNKNNTNKEKL